MTDFQAKQIEALRGQGKGYKAIASAVGLSRDIVRNYCKANGMEGYADAAVLNMRNRLNGGINSTEYPGFSEGGLDG